MPGKAGPASIAKFDSGRCWAGVLAVLSVVLASPRPAAGTKLTIDFQRVSSTAFDGVGAVSGGGGTSRLLFDYAEPERGRILDALFGNRSVGALQMIKVEIGGDAQSTEAAEASHMHTRDDGDLADEAAFNRGYEWFVIAEAKRRDPTVKVLALSWGVPGWVGNGSYFAGDDNIEYHIRWAEGLQRHHNVTLDFIGVWNESPVTALNGGLAWIKRLRKRLDATPGLQGVRIIGGDNGDGWPLCAAMAADAELRAAVAVVAAHYAVTVGGQPTVQPTAAVPLPPPLRFGPGAGAPPAVCRALGKPLWTSEGWHLGQSCEGGWDGALNLAATLNRNWASGAAMGAMLVWALTFAWYPQLPFAGHGLLKAIEPWSGHWELSPPLRLLAHTTKFAAPGAGCRYVEVNATAEDGFLVRGSGGGANGSAFGGTSVVALSCDDGGSVVVETALEILPSAAPVVLDLHGLSASLGGGGGGGNGGDNGRAPRAGAVSAWRTCEGDARMARLPDVPAQGGPGLVLSPRCVYSFSSRPVTNLHLEAVLDDGPLHVTPPPSPFPLPYADNFDAYRPNATVKFFTDEGGSFCAATAPTVPALSALLPPALAGASAAATATGGVLSQVVRQPPVSWDGAGSPDPFSLVGDGGWTDVSVRVRGAMRAPPPTNSTNATSYIRLCGRVGNRGGESVGDPIVGYCADARLLGHSSGSGAADGAAERGITAWEWRWELRESGVLIHSGALPGGGAWSAWQQLRLDFAGDTLRVLVNGVRVVSLGNATASSSGLAAVGCGWHEAMFDDFEVLPTQHSDRQSRQPRTRPASGTAATLEQ